MDFPLVVDFPLELPRCSNPAVRVRRCHSLQRHVEAACRPASGRTLEQFPEAEGGAGWRWVPWKFLNRGTGHGFSPRKVGARDRTPLPHRKPTEDEQAGQHCPDHRGALLHRGSLKMPMATKAGQVIGSFRGGSDPSPACRPTNQAGFILNTGEAGTFFQKDSRKGRADSRDLGDKSWNFLKVSRLRGCRGTF